MLFLVVKNAIVGTQSDLIKTEALRSKVDERVVRLSDAISRDLTTPDIKKAQMQKSVKLLLRLGYGEQVSFVTLDILFCFGRRIQNSHSYFKGASNVS